MPFKVKSSMRRTPAKKPIQTFKDDKPLRVKPLAVAATARNNLFTGLKPNNTFFESSKFNLNSPIFYLPRVHSLNAQNAKPASSRSVLKAPPPRPKQQVPTDPTLRTEGRWVDRVEGDDYRYRIRTSSRHPLQ